MIDNYTYWIQKYGINVHLDQEVTINTVKELNPDVVFVATGTIPIKPPILGIDRKNVFWANDVFTGDAPVGRNNVVIGGGATGVELAIYLAKYGQLSLEAFDFLTQYHALEPDVALGMIHNGRNKVTILEQLPRLGSALGKSTKWVLLNKVDALGAKKLANVRVTEIGEDYVNYSDAEENEHVIDGVDYVYYATGVVPNDSLFKDIKALGIQVEKIGDVRKPQTVLDAIARAYKLGNNI
ncbi:MAG: FAD-dependent oxidoreductase [Promethearchaeota archaeon]